MKTEIPYQPTPLRFRGTSMKLKRLCHACCGMEDGKIYNGEYDGVCYARVLLPDGNWTSGHAARGFFAQVHDDGSETIL